jgi:TonB family protein
MWTAKMLLKGHLMKAILVASVCGVIASLLFPLPFVFAEEGIVEWDKPPAIIGGMDSLQNNIIYPKAALKDSIQGMVLVSVEIRADGTLGGVSILESVREDLNEAAQDAIRKTQWLPAEKDGKPISCTVTVPIQFKLESKK